MTNEMKIPNSKSQIPNNNQKSMTKTPQVDSEGEWALGLLSSFMFVI